MVKILKKPYVKVNTVQLYKKKSDKKIKKEFKKRKTADKLRKMDQHIVTLQREVSEKVRYCKYTLL